MKRHYATLSGPEGPWQLHYREHGAGPPCVLLHPSPLSSAFMVPTMQQLAPQLRCLALDTPGYGASDPLPVSWNAQNLTPYVAALHEFVTTLELDCPVLYGSATGAQIAIEFAKAHPASCRGLLLENVALFTQEEREQIVEGYFPDLTPRPDGAHLQTLWAMARDSMRYFPWYERGADADRRGTDADPMIAAAMVRDYLLAGPDYARAYRAAFANESLEQLSGVDVATRIVLWDEGLLGEYSERLMGAELPAPIAIRRAAAGMAARLQAVADAAAELLALSGASPATHTA